MSKIVKLEAEAFKRLRAVTITPDGALVQVRGRNGQGKTSALDAIAAAIGGEALCPTEPIRRGEAKARVSVELDDGMVVERRWTASGSRLEVRTKEGAVFKTPQKLLDGLVGKLSFDPLAFLRLKPQEQAETLRRLAGVDFSLLDGKRRAAYDARTGANRQVAQLRARLAAMPEVEAPAELVSAPELLAEQQRRSEVRTANERKREKLEEARRSFQRLLDDIERFKAEAAKLEQELLVARNTVARLERARDEEREQGSALRAEVEQLVDPDLQEIPAKLREVEQVNERVRAKRARAAAAGELAQAEAEAAKLEAEIAGVDEQKAEALRQAHFPVDGLAFTEAGVTLGGLPLEQASSAEQLRVSLAMGIALNPKLKVLLIRDGSLLDEASLRLVAEMAERSGVQVWIEIVSTEGAGGVVIEDGQVVGAEVPKEAASA